MSGCWVLLASVVTAAVWLEVGGVPEDADEVSMVELEGCEPE